MVWNEDAHPRASAGTATGGQFAAGGSGPAPTTTVSTHPGRKSTAVRLVHARKVKVPPKGGGGGGRGAKGGKGNTRVRTLQAALNRLGATDGKGAKLAVDGKFGPRTTQAVKKAQAALGLPVDGRVSPKLLHRLTKLKTLPVRAKASVTAFELLYGPSAAWEAWDSELHPRGVHGRFAHGHTSPDVVEVRANRRVRIGLKPPRRSPRSAGLTDEHWRAAFEAHGVRGETFDEYKRRATARALAQGMTRDSKGFFYAPGDVQQRYPLSASGFPLGGLAPPRTEGHRRNRPGAERGEIQHSAGMPDREGKQRRVSAGKVRLAGGRPVGTDVGQQRAARVRATPGISRPDPAQVKSLRGRKLADYAEQHGMSKSEVLLLTDAAIRERLLRKR